MRLFIALLMAATLSLGLAGCKKSADTGSASASASSQPQDAEGQVRTAIQAHLAHNSNLNLQAFDTDIKQVTINGDHAQAQVDFRVKGGPGVMQLTYQLERREGAWAIIDSNPAGSNFSHPPLDQGQNPAGSTPGGASHSLSDTLKSFKEGGSNSAPNLPPGHPPINTPPGTMPQ